MCLCFVLSIPCFQNFIIIIIKNSETFCKNLKTISYIICMTQFFTASCMTSMICICEVLNSTDFVTSYYYLGGLFVSIHHISFKGIRCTERERESSQEITIQHVQLVIFLWNYISYKS